MHGAFASRGRVNAVYMAFASARRGYAHCWGWPNTCTVQAHGGRVVFYMLINWLAKLGQPGRAIDLRDGEQDPKQTSRTAGLTATLKIANSLICDPWCPEN